MKMPLLAVVAALALTASVPAQQPDKPDKDAEKLPEYPKLDPKNTTAFLNKEKTILAELTGEEGKKKVVRIGLVSEVCLREGPLEEFLCKKGTKEHESIVRIDADAQFVHAALATAGAKAGTPTEFVDATGDPKWKAATGTKINVIVHYTMGGKTFTHPAQEWIRDREKTKKEKKDVTIPHGWVFAGSRNSWTPATRPASSTRPTAATSSASRTSLLDARNAGRNLEGRRLPDLRGPDGEIPAFSKVWVILEPVK